MKKKGRREIKILFWVGRNRKSKGAGVMEGCIVLCLMGVRA